MSERACLGWSGIVRLGLVQAALGAIVVLTTSTMNRVMVVEFALPAMLPGALVALHHVIQMSRPRFGYGSDVGGRRTPWIIGGMLVLALGGIAHRAIIKALGLRQADYKFGHAALHDLGRFRLLDSYHCSRYNTQTRRLTPAMFEQVFARARELIAEPVADA